MNVVQDAQPSDSFRQQLRQTIATETSTPLDVMSLIASELSRAADIGLVTITSVDPVDQSYERLYSSMPDVYPVAGKKPANKTWWSDIVMERKESFVANDKDSLAEVMADYELITSLGFESILNVPIVEYGRVIGTLNCLSGPHHFSPKVIAACEEMVVPAILALRTAASRP